MEPVVERHISRSAAETRALGAALARALDRGSVVALRGELGSGKTCLIQGVCRGLAVEDRVNSPTFILINEYVGRCRGQTVPVYHFDLYRLGRADELEELGAEEYFYGEGICLVEWAERAGGMLPRTRIDIELEYLGGDERRIVVRRLPG